MSKQPPRGASVTTNEVAALAPPHTPADDAAIAEEPAALHRRRTLDFALAVGRLVVDRLYGGDLVAWRVGGSLRKLAQRLEALQVRGLSATALQQAVATLHLEER